MAVTTSAATLPPEPIALRECVTDTTRVRRGPSTQYETTGRLPLGTCLTILGRDASANWAYMVSDDHQTGWVAVSLLSGAGGINKVSVRDEAALVNTGRPTLTSEEIAYGAKAYLTKVSATNIPGAPITQYFVPCFETANRIGQHISCRIEKAVCDYLPALEGSPTFCTDKPYPDHTFALIVLGEDWSEYDGQCIIVSGYLGLDKGMLQIEAFGRDQVAHCY